MPSIPRSICSYLQSLKEVTVAAYSEERKKNAVGRFQLLCAINRGIDMSGLSNSEL